ncbi:MAG: response regulator [Deltaproteobacteria bacterium]|nr:response regulator [Deltaproteobacteria bacterium]
MKLKQSEIAIIDDDDLFRKSAVAVLARNLQKDILSFESGVAALEHLEQNNSIEIILSDINMPVMDGLEFLKRVKEKYPDKICIMMSGYPGNEQTAMNLGADAYINKPFSTQEIADLMRSLVRLNGGRHCRH